MPSPSIPLLPTLEQNDSHFILYILQQQKFHQVQQKVENLGTGTSFIIYNHFSSPSYSANLIIELSPIPNSLPLPYNFIPHIPPSAHQFSQRSLGVKSEGKRFLFSTIFFPLTQIKIYGPV